MKKSFRAVDVVAIVSAICALMASWVVFERPYGTMGMIAAQFAPFVALFVAPGVVVFARKPLRPANYPRIDHLRIAGKYQAAVRFGETGISPLHLRR